MKPLTYLPVLRRLDLSKNNLDKIAGIAQCISLRWLNLATNQVSKLKPLSTLTSLQVSTCAAKLKTVHHEPPKKLDCLTTHRPVLQRRCVRKQICMTM